MAPRRRLDSHAPAPRKPGSLLGLTEIAALLGVSRQRVHELSQHPDFPAPEVELSSGRVWRTEAIDRWVRTHRDTGRANQA